MSKKQRFIKLSESERIKLESGYKSGKQSTFRQRCHYILLSSQGKSINEISEIYQRHRVSITTWFNRYESSGIEGLQTAKGRGRPPIVRIDNISEVKQIEDWVEDSSQNLKPVLVKIKKEFGKQMGKRTLTRLLKKRLEVETLSKDTP